MEKTYAFALLAIPALASTLWADALSLYADVATVGDQAQYFPPPSTEEGAHSAQVVDTRRVVPSSGLPAELPVAASNNTLDVVRHQGRVYLAFRTAAHHHVDPGATIQVLSTNDELTWVKETSFSTGAEIREPRFLSFRDRLFLYASEPAVGQFGVQPGSVLASHRDTSGWSAPRALDLPRHVVWNTKVQNGIPLMTAYSSEGSFVGSTLDVKLLTTSDGYHWHPLLAGRSTVYSGGGSQAAFTSDDDGNLYSVIKSNAGGRAGWGSSVCFAPEAAWTNWDCVNDRKRYDSPAMFSYDGEVYLVGRRNLTEDGAYDQGFGPHIIRALTNQLDYVTAGKRCSLWRYIKSERRIAFVLDLPSRGDTCFPSVVAGDKQGQFIIYNYSSDIAGPELSLGVAQTEQTFIYRHVLELSRKQGTKNSGL